ncbi:MAG: MotA/TolQ/ExbB proton channel family protein [bacterium]
MDFLTKGGFFMWPILLVSIAALALALERVYVLWMRYRQDGQGLLKAVLNRIEKEDYPGALDACSHAADQPLNRVIRAGLLKVHRSDKEIEMAMEEEMLRATPVLRSRINYLATFANVATLLGLLGTIQGLIQAFEGVGMADPAAKQEILAKGISVAMLTTFFGLIVAIPCLLVHSFLQNKSGHMIEAIEERAFTVYNKICSLHRDLERKEPRARVKAVEGGRRS